MVISHEDDGITLVECEVGQLGLLDRFLFGQLGVLINVQIKHLDLIKGGTGEHYLG